MVTLDEDGSSRPEGCLVDKKEGTFHTHHCHVLKTHQRAPVNMTATIMRTPMAMPSMKRRKVGSQENDGRALKYSES